MKVLIRGTDLFSQLIKIEDINSLVILDDLDQPVYVFSSNDSYIVASKPSEPAAEGILADFKVKPVPVASVKV